ncbi:helix-turn-helix domain-containing protein, partial [Micromonospora mangrovi]
WPSVATIADYAGVSVRTVQRTLAKLVNLGRLAVRQVATLATRIYRLLSGRPDTSGGDIPRSGVTDDATRGDTHRLSPEAEEDHKKLRGHRSVPSGRRLSLRNRLPRQTSSASGAAGRPAASSVARTADHCPRHRGSLATHCGPCRSEMLAGGLR